MAGNNLEVLQYEQPNPSTESSQRPEQTSKTKDEVDAIMRQNNYVDNTYQLTSF